MKYTIYILSFLILQFYSCSDNITNQVNSSGTSSYFKVISVDSADMKFELWNLESSNLYPGYNEIGFKVFINGTEKKNGFVKFIPLMYHTGGSSHTTPVKEYFYFDESKSMFTGYICLLMASDSSTSFWFADYNYNNEKIIKQNRFEVVQSNDNQMRFWYDASTLTTYSLSNISPKFKPAVGKNEFKCILHKKDTSEIYYEVDSAEMHINAYLIQSTPLPYNINPVWIGNGTYSGSVEFSSRGEWMVTDSVKYKGRLITGTTPPKFFFYIY